MTYNIHHANPPARKDVIDIEAIATVIKTQDPDLVALQELDVNTRRSGGVDQVRKLAELTGMQAFCQRVLIMKAERMVLPFFQNTRSGVQNVSPCRLRKD